MRTEEITGKAFEGVGMRLDDVVIGAIEASANLSGAVAILVKNIKAQSQEIARLKEENERLKRGNAGADN